MAEGGGGGERQFLGNFVRNQAKYGSTTKPAPRSSSFVKHPVKQDDTLMGIALRYGSTVEQIKRENKLWTNDSLFLKEFLLIPVTNENSNLITDEWEIVTAENRSRSNSEITSTEDKKIPIQNDSPEKPARNTHMDFFNKFDADIAQLKSNVKELEKNTSFKSDEGTLDFPPRRNSETNSRHVYQQQWVIDSPDSPVLVIRSRTQSYTVQNSLRRSEKAIDDLFEL
ncbi:hypothetical protein CHS0354_029174 [Potamilus streckersoni]|uniref:LysM domain-containing protein n=1 Tax=Potamilus streckersoni TaxID=2493646 RepID=A0AAE0RUC8_9BIVA|nr:hypothetical protein CHS0354_029174 [Potamilus streckersoni]